MWMSEKEQAFFKSYLNKNQRILEWGCGSSTVELCKIVKEVHSIEHNRDWYNKINQELLNFNNVNLYLCEPDIEYVEGGDCGSYDQFKTYITKPIELGKFDLIFIDGRSRIECSKICKLISNKDALIFVHDYRHRYDRENYKLIEESLLFISEIENLTLFKIKP